MANTAKKKAFYDAAERMYVEDMNTINEIAKKMHLHIKTISNWKIEGGWDEKRKMLLITKKSLDAELYEIARDLVKKVREDLKNPDSKIDTGRLYALNNLLSMLKPVKDYEDVKDDKKPGDKPKSKDEVVKTIMEALGISNEK